MSKVCSFSFHLKSIDTEERSISGIATTPDVDRMGDIVDPMGLSYAESIPLLWQHNADMPVGRARLGKATPKGIPFTARIVKESEPGRLKDRADEAWQCVKHGIVDAVSIGFRTLGDGVARMKEGGLHFLKGEVLELSLTPIPAQPKAVIGFFKSLDAAVRNGNTGELEELLQAHSFRDGATPQFDRIQRSPTGQTARLPGVSGSDVLALPGGAYRLIPRKYGNPK